MLDDKSEILAGDIVAEYEPDSHEKWQSVLRLVSRMSTNSDYRAADRQTFNHCYQCLKMRYRQWEREKSVSVPKGVLK